MHDSMASVPDTALLRCFCFALSYLREWDHMRLDDGEHEIFSDKGVHLAWVAGCRHILTSTQLVERRDYKHSLHFVSQQTYVSRI